CLAEAARGRGRMVVLLGEAGIGKTRLLGEVARVAADRGVHRILGRCYESERILPFGPWVDALRRPGIPAGRASAPGPGPAWRAQIGRLLPGAGEGPARSAPASDDLVRLFESVSRLVAALSAGRSLLLVVEDLHWADEMSLRLLAFLSRRI